MHKRIVLTGLGVLASNGAGKEQFWKALKDGVSGIKPVSLFGTSHLRTRSAGEIFDFRPEDILGPKGLRNLDRTTKLALCASKMALDDAGIPAPIDEAQTDSFGVCVGSTLGSVWSISEFDKESLRDGPRSVNPALFPNTVINSPASHISIRFNVKGFNATISSGFCSSLDAFYYGLNMLTLHDYDVVLVGGVEDLSEQAYKGFYKIGMLAGSRAGKDEVNCPFDRRRNGIMLGEGAAMVVMETLENAKSRKAHIYAEVRGYGTSFDGRSKNICSPGATGATQAIRACLDDAHLDAADIDHISSSANSTLDCDAMETSAVHNIFGKRSGSVPVSSIKSMIGECFSASGAMSLAAALGSIEENFVPPTINYTESDRRCDLDCVPNVSRERKIDSVLINSFSPTGPNSSMVISRYKK